MDRRQFIVGFAASIYATSALGGQRMIGYPHAGRSPVFGRQGAVASSQPLASQAGLTTLKSGGSAVDAAIATAAVLAVCEPMMSGPGGDLFAQVYDPSSGKLLALDSAGKASGRAKPVALRSKHKSDAMPKLGPDAVSVPGAIYGWFELHGRYGKLPFSEVLQPAIHYAENGFPVGPQTALDWSFASLISKGLEAAGYKSSEFNNTFLPDGKTPARGAIFTNANLANTFRLIRDEGSEGFYKGRIAEKILTALDESDLSFEAQDLSAMMPAWVETAGTQYRGIDFTQLPPPGQGITMLHILALLREYDVASMGFNSIERNHLIMEVIKTAYSDRANFIADPAFAHDLPNVLDETRLSEQRKAINLQEASVNAIHGALEEGDTSYITAADSSGMMVSLITSVSGPFGSGVVPEGLGFCLQNRAASFTLQKGHANEIQPNKKPFHTIIPAFAMKYGKPWMSFGLMGGAMQPQGQAQVIVNLLDHKMDLQQAGDAPRLRLYGGPQPDGGVQESPVVWRVEKGFLNKTISGLRDMGHVIEIGYPEPTIRYGGYQAIRHHENGAYEAATELRQDGQALAY